MPASRSLQTILTLTVGATVLFSGTGLAQAAPSGSASHPVSVAKASAKVDKGKVDKAKAKAGKVKADKAKAAAEAKALVKDKAAALKAAAQVEKDLGRVTAALSKATNLTEAHRSTLVAAQAAVQADISTARQRIEAATTRAAVSAQSAALRTLRNHVHGVGRAVQVVDKADAAVVEAAQAHAELLAAVEQAQAQGKDLTALTEEIDAAAPALADATAALNAAADLLANNARTATGHTVSKVSQSRDALELVETGIDELTAQVLALLDPQMPEEKVGEV